MSTPFKTGIDEGFNFFHSIDDLTGLSDTQKIAVLEWFARKLWVILEEGSGDSDYYGKSYDPLVIEPNKKIAHSYVFSISRDSGRHHHYEELTDIEDALVAEAIDRILWLINDHDTRMDSDE